MSKFKRENYWLIVLIIISTNYENSKAQTTCKNGLGRVLYERLPNQQLQGYDDDVVRDTAPPFRVLEKCQDLCLRDRTGTNNLVRTCTSFDFQPGSRITSFGSNTEYEESLCYLTTEQAGPEGIGSLMLVPNSVHFNEICLTSSRPERECPSRRYVFERHPRKKLKLPISDIKEITAANRSDCEDKCLNEFSFVCRSANFDSTMRSCTLSRFTRRTHPELLEDDPNSDYLENTCLNAERRCDGLAVFVKEENKRLGGPFEVDIFSNMTLEECQTVCLRAEKYFCRSVEFDDQSKLCVLSEEDSVSQKDDISLSSSPTHHFYDLVCLDNQRATDYPDNSITSHLFSSGRRPDTAFQRYRNSRLGGEFHSEITGRSLSECLDECLRQTSFQCRSAVYSDRFRTCRLSRYNQKDGMRIIYDADYDYYENLMLNVVGSIDNDGNNIPNAGNAHRPSDQSGHNWRRPNKDDDHYGGDGSHYGAGSDLGRPYDRYPDGPNTSDYDRNPYERPGDRYGNRDEDRGRYPSLDTPYDEKYPLNRYPGYDRPRYPVSKPEYYTPSNRDRFPAPGRGQLPNDRGGPKERDQYTPDTLNRYPEYDRYPFRDRYSERHRQQYEYGYYDRYPDRYGDRLYNRYPSEFDDRERYPDEVRYPPKDNFNSNRPAFQPEGYPPITDNSLPNDLPHSRPYPPVADRPYRPYRPNTRHSDDSYANRYPAHYPPTRDHAGGYPGRDAPEGVFPDRRFRPSSFDSRYPLLTLPRDRISPPSRFPLEEDSSFGPGRRYPTDEIIHSAHRPEPDSAKRYPAAPLVPPTSVSKYPSSPNRFPIGTDRAQISIYKYNNRYGGEIRPGYGRPSPPYYDLEYDERYGERERDSDRFGPYDHEYGIPVGRRPTLHGFSTYETPFNRPYSSGGSIHPIEEPIKAHPHGGLPPGAYGTGGAGISRPIVTRCEESDNFKQVAARHKMRRNFVRRSLTVPSLVQCERECIESQDFLCRSFNYRDSAASSYDDRDLPNCELSDRDSRELDVHDPNLFDAANYDFYERSISRSDGECMDVTQTCNEEGMEFTIRTPDGFQGRIYTYGYYDRCFFRGNGGTVNVLRISGPQGYPDCGTQRYGDTLTNIVVVQFSDNVQTSRDKRYNLTCVFRGPGEAVVTSGYIGAGSGSPIPIEYLPAENTLSSKVRLMILYQGRPTTTIAVGDPLTFRLEAQDGYNHLTDIFATNVVARDPYSGRSIQLIDRFGCPIDPYVFPELDKLRDGDTLEARFNAFKIPESNFLVFEATVRTCREGCQPAYCPGPSGRQEPSFGRRRRSVVNENKENATEEAESEVEAENSNAPDKTTEELIGNRVATNENTNISNAFWDNFDKNESMAETLSEIEEPEQVREMIEVFETREEIENEAFPRKLVAPAETICMTPSEYQGMITAIILLIILLLSISLLSGLAYRRYWRIMSKNRILDRHSPVHSFGHSSIRTHERFSEIGNSNTTRPTTTTNRSASNIFRSNMSMFGGTLHKTFATGNLARMCQLPVMNPIRHSGNSSHQFDDPSEPIYTDPSLFERSRTQQKTPEILEGFP